ncbi:unnamed protein product, partial [Ectocarpus sp. 12 AP-2014]
SVGDLWNVLLSLCRERHLVCSGSVYTKVFSVASVLLRTLGSLRRGTSPARPLSALNAVYHLLGLTRVPGPWGATILHSCHVSNVSHFAWSSEVMGEKPAMFLPCERCSEPSGQKVVVVRGSPAQIGSIDQRSLFCLL